MTRVVIPLVLTLLAAATAAPGPCESCQLLLTALHKQSRLAGRLVPLATGCGEFCTKASPSAAAPLNAVVGRGLWGMPLKNDSCWPFPEDNCPWENVKDHMPAVDDDKDMYSTFPRLRGTNWRGKDCNDHDAAVYPGRQTDPSGAAGHDYNCNGIAGVDPASGKPWKQVLCDGTQPRGVAVIGDSASAHFAVPLSVWNSTDELVLLGENELDYPHCSWGTAYEAPNSTNTSDKVCPNSILPMESIYLHLRERNRCNHRDYQNLGVNGWRVTHDMGNGSDAEVKVMARHQTDDAPLLVFFSPIGNDVCNGHPGLDHMTTPEEFYRDVTTYMKFLDTKLPAGSHVVFIGLIGSDIMWEVMANRIEPETGLTYAVLWEILGKLGKSPCWGWLNPEKQWRDLTTQRAHNLSAVYDVIIANNTYQHFDMHYIDYPITEQVIADWKSQGHDAADLFEQIGGGHPSTSAHILEARIVWQWLLQHPDLIGPENPNNAKIIEMFGDQGGH